MKKIVLALITTSFFSSQCQEVPSAQYLSTIAFIKKTSQEGKSIPAELSRIAAQRSLPGNIKPGIAQTLRTHYLPEYSNFASESFNPIVINNPHFFDRTQFRLDDRKLCINTKIIFDELIVDGKTFKNQKLKRLVTVENHAGEPRVESVNHNNQINSAEFSPDGKKIVTASNDKLARIIDAYTGKLIAEINHDKSVSSAHFSPDGSKIATASDDNTVKIVDTQTGKTIQIIQTHAIRPYDTINKVLFSPDGKKIALEKDTSIELVNLETTKAIIFNYASGGTFSNDSTEFVLYTFGKTEAIIFDVDTGVAVTTIKLDRRPNTASFSPDGTKLFFAYNIYDLQSKGLVELFDRTLNKIISTYHFNDTIRSVQFNSKGTQFFITTKNNTIIFPILYEDDDHLITFIQLYYLLTDPSLETIKNEFLHFQAGKPYNIKYEELFNAIKILPNIKVDHSNKLSIGKSIT